MADDKAKKSKIDLKARLGKTTQVGGLQAPGPMAMPPGATPLPSAPPSEPGAPSAPPPPSSAPAAASARPVPAPIGIAPPPGLSPGIPIPPFAQPQRPKAEPKPTAAQQTIKVEIGEEIEHERKKWKTRVALGALAGALVGAGIGFVAGGSSEKGGQLKTAARGASSLKKDVEASGEKLKELQAKLGEAAEKLKTKAYPEDLATALAGLNVPFDSSNLDGKNVGFLPQRVMKQVLNFTSAVEQLNKSRESLKNIVGIAKDPITKAWKEETTPVVNFSVVFRTEGGKTVVGELVPNKEPFNWKGDYPGSYKVMRLEGGKAVDKSANRWQKGELPGNDLTAVPLDPRSVAAFTSEQLIGKLNKAIYDMRIELEGNKEDPNSTGGLTKMAEDLANDLGKAARNQ